MDHDQDRGQRSTPVAPVVLPSRRAALDRARAALTRGPILVTGEPGSGKTWLADRLAAEVKPPWSWARIDAAPDTTPADLVSTIGHRLGLDFCDRQTLADTLLDATHDGHRWGLVIDEAHLAGRDVLEEFRLLANRLGEPDGFDVLILVAQSQLLRRLRMQPGVALRARLSLIVPVPPIDRDEARLLVDALGQQVPDRVLDRLHTDFFGNVRGLIRQVSLMAAPAPTIQQERVRGASSLSPARDALGDEPSPSPQSGPPHPLSGLGRSKPPLRLEENLIEVGWQPELEALAEPSESADGEPALPVPVDDHYTAIQAWNEWARNQGRQAAEPPDLEADAALPAPVVEAAFHGGPDVPEPPVPETLRTGSGQVWIDPQQPFAPYSQLFTRTRQRDTGPGHASS